VQVARLFRPEVLSEVEAVAVVKAERREPAIEPVREVIAI
jgi:hypothetical protein